MTSGPLAAPGAPVRRAGRLALGAVRAPLLVGAGTAAFTALLALHSPYESGSYGFCPLHAVTGWWCPLCGGLRATHDLARGDVAAAWGMNPLWVVLAPVIAVVWLVWLVRRAQGRALATPSVRVQLVLAGVLVVFGVLRNIPALAPWLAP